MRVVALGVALRQRVEVFGVAPTILLPAQRVPALRLLTRPETDIRDTANTLIAPLSRWAGPDWHTDVTEDRSQIGSGSLPLDLLPSAAVRLTPKGGNKRERGRQLKALSARLRQLPIPVIGRIADEALLLDCRCLEEADPLVAQLEAGASAP